MDRSPAEPLPPDRAWAIRPCFYGGRRLERGELFTLADLPTDERLIAEHYVQRLLPKHHLYHCDPCNRDFVGGENFDLHRHAVHG